MTESDTSQTLSLQQEFINALDKGDEMGSFGPAYVLASAWRLRGPVDPAVLAGALDDVVARHEILRTPVSRGTSVALPADPAPAPVQLAVHDLSGTPLDERDLRGEELLNAVEAGRYPATELPHLRAALAVFAPDDAVLVLLVHHLVADGWSMGVLMHDVAHFYAARSGHDVPALAPARQYHEFAAAQRAGLGDKSVAKAVAYWGEQLAGAEISVIPADRPFAGKTAVYAAQRFLLDAELTGATSKLAKSLRASPFMVFLSAYNLLLRELTGTDDIVAASFSAGRGLGDFHHAVGPFLNFVPLRTKLAGSRTFADVLDRTRTSCLGAYSHELPFPLIAGAAPDLMGPAMAPERDLPAFELLQFPADKSSETVGGLSVTELRRRLLSQDVSSGIPDGIVWALDVLPTGETVAGLKFDTNLFDAETIRSWGHTFERILRAAVTDPDAPLPEWAPAVAETTETPVTNPAAAALAAALIEAEDARKGELAILLGLAVEAEEGQPAGAVTAAVRAHLDDYLSIWRETTDEALSLALLYLVAHFPQDRTRVLDTATTLPLDPEDLSRLRRALAELDPDDPDIGRVFPHPAAWELDEAARRFDQARISALGAEKIAELWLEDTETVLGHLGVKARWAVRNGPVLPASSDSVPDRDLQPAAAGAELLAQHAAAFRCPGCGGSLRLEGNLATCEACSNAYPVEKGILDLTARVGETGDDFLLKLAQVPGMGHYYEAHARPNFVRLCGSNWAGQVLPSDEDDYIATHVRPVDGPVLDLAAGAGRWTEVLAKTVGPERVIALDLLLPMLVTLRGRLPEVPAVLASAATLPFGDASLGAVLCWNALQAFPAQAPAAIAEVARCLRPGGTFTVLTFRNSDDPVYRYFARRHRFPAHNDGLTLFDRDELVGWLTDAGLEIEDETTPGTFLIINAVRP